MTSLRSLILHCIRKSVGLILLAGFLVSPAFALPLTHVEKEARELIFSISTGRIERLPSLLRLAHEHPDSLQPHTLLIVRIQEAQASNKPRQVLLLTDSLLHHYASRLEARSVSYHAQLHINVLLEEGNYPQLHAWASYLAKRFIALPEVINKARHYIMLADSARSFGPCRVKRPPHTSVMHYTTERNVWTMPVTVGRDTLDNIVLDTGNPLLTLLSRDLALRAGVHLLPDTFVTQPFGSRDIYHLQRAVCDSLRWGDVTFYNLPVALVREGQILGHNGIIGYPDMRRLQVMTLRDGEIHFPFPLPAASGEPNIFQPADEQNSRIMLPCRAGGQPYNFILDTGTAANFLSEDHAASGGVIQLYGQSLPLSGIKYRRTGCQDWGLLGHSFIYSFDSLRFDFRTMHLQPGRYARFQDARDLIARMDIFAMMRNRSRFLLAQPDYVPYVDVFTASQLNRPWDVLRLTDALLASGTVADDMTFALLMLQQQAYFDTGNYGGAWSSASKAIQYLDATDEASSPARREQLKSLILRNRMLIGARAMTIHFRDSRLRLNRQHEARCLIGNVQERIKLSITSADNCISLSKAKQMNFLIRRDTLRSGGRPCFIALAPFLRLGHIVMRDVPFLVIDADTVKTTLGLGLLRRLHSVTCHRGRHLVFLAADTSRAVLPFRIAQSLKAQVAGGHEFPLTDRMFYRSAATALLDFDRMVCAGMKEHE